MKMHTSNQISDWVLSKTNTDAGDTISPLKLQKLLYYCQAWHLTIIGKELFSEDIEAWAHGPVVPSQYARFAHISRTDRIDICELELSPAKLSDKSLHLLNEVMNIYGEHSASYLEALTHQETPWIQARKGVKSWERSTEVISHKSMIKYYSQLKNNG
tara:strand:+ start:1013 stop:1486 length:474 start_codon:yes stop_codon:yes gene_type:complete